MRPTWLLVFVLACGPKPEPEEPKPEPAPAAKTNDDDALHTAFVDTHRQAVEECFGGFGKGAPYAGTFTVSGGNVTEASFEKLSDGHGELPADCMAKHYTAMDLPSGTADGTIEGRFAVKNDACDVPDCGEKDLPCVFKRDIACSVVIE